MSTRDISQSCPHSTSAPDGVCDACRGVAVEPAKGIQRYDCYDGELHGMGESHTGEYVLYTDHLAALSRAGAPARGDDAALREAIRAGIAVGVPDMVDSRDYDAYQIRNIADAILAAYTLTPRKGNA